MRYLLIISIILILLVSGCISSQNETGEQSTEEMAKQKCIDLCKIVKFNERALDLSNGPCLSDNNLNWNIQDWVCDVAHSPREDVDNLAENQCKDYGEGKAHHFVEVDPECNFIRAI